MRRRGHGIDLKVLELAQELGYHMYKISVNDNGAEEALMKSLIAYSKENNLDHYHAVLDAQHDYLRLRARRDGQLELFDKKGQPYTRLEQ
jgi:hypothetical protein